MFFDCIAMAFIINCRYVVGSAMQFSEERIVDDEIGLLGGVNNSV